MGNGENESAVEQLLLEALSLTLTRRMADRIVGDVQRNRAGQPLPTDTDELLALVRSDLTKAAYLRVGSRAPAAIAVVEDRVMGLAVAPIETLERPRIRLVYVGRCPRAAEHVAREIGAHPVARVDELFELLIALDSDERTLVVVDAADTKLDPTVLARFVPDFPSHVLTFVASSPSATREAFLSAGAAFRATLRTEPMDHPDVPQLMRDLVRGVAGGNRRTRGGTSTTTEPAHHAA